MEASRSHAGAVALRKVQHRRAALALTTAATSIVMVAIACGGTTGREGLSMPGADATVDDGGWETGIEYIDRVLPDLYVAPMNSDGGEAGVWPGCAPDLPALIPLDETNLPLFDAGFVIALDGAVPSGWTIYEVPSIWLDDGGEDVAPDGSVCATQVWFGSAACDTCIRLLTSVLPGGAANSWEGEYGPTANLPPCSDMMEAGLAVAGPGTNRPRLDLCHAAFDCIAASHCAAADSVSACYCEAGSCFTTGPNGVCGAAIQAALEVQGSTPADTIQKMTLVFQNVRPPTAVGHGGSSLGNLIALIQGNCKTECAGSAGSQ
jgi:hypothetical protein